MTRYQIPTGVLFVDDYEKGQLETLSIGDYGKAANVKADFLGYDRPLMGVPNGKIMPLSEKWVVTLSTQYGCVMKCTFCDVPKVPWKGNVGAEDLRKQLYSALRMFPGVRYTERLNIHFARMGEPIFNLAVFEFSRWLSQNKQEIYDALGLRIEVIHPVLTTSLPKKLKDLRNRLIEWGQIKNGCFNGQAGLQLSINSTNDLQREEMFAGQSLNLEEISKIVRDMPEPLSRKYCLNFALATGYEVGAKKLAGLFDPDHWMVKITPIHNNNACRENGIETKDGYGAWEPYEKAEKELKKVGFDVLVFVPSWDEERGLVTCGNAILGGSKLKV